MARGDLADSNETKNDQNKSASVSNETAPNCAPPKPEHDEAKRNRWGARGRTGNS